MKEKTYKRLLVWQKADELVLQIYKMTTQFPPHEIYGITSQLRRAAVSVPTNIVEGVGRQSKKELKRFVTISLGSLAETEYLLELCLRLGYLTEEDYKHLENLRDSVGGLLWKFYQSL